MGHWAETQASTLNIQQVRNVPSTGFPDAFVDIHVIPGSPGEPIAKRIVSDGTVCHGPIFRSRRRIFWEQNS